jgi:hypothetical protein
MGGLGLLSASIDPPASVTVDVLNIVARRDQRPLGDRSTIDVAPFGLVRPHATRSIVEGQHG